MLRMPPGSFVRIDERDRDAKPQQVTLTRLFFLSDREVSVGLFQQFVDDPDYPHEKPTEWEGPDRQASPTPDHPVQRVNWFDAMIFCNWLSRREGRTPCYEYKGKSADEKEIWELIPTADGYRLPTEAEWEYACQSKSETNFTFGDGESLLEKYAVFNTRRTQPTGSRLPNAWGLFDMHGNVWEWCQDWYGHYASLPTDDPQGPETGALRVVQGGGWLSHAWFCQAACRRRRRPLQRDNNVGFRLARTVSSPAPSR